jgi:archaeosine synthase
MAKCGAFEDAKHGCSIPAIAYHKAGPAGAPDFAELVMDAPLALNELVAEGGPTYCPYPLSCEGSCKFQAGGEPLMLSGSPAEWSVALSDGGRRWLGLCVIPNAVELYSSPEAFAERLAAFKGAAADRAVLYAPAVATPGNLAVLAYAGVDLFDDVQCILAARQGRELFHGGSAPTDEGFAETVAANRLALHTELGHVRRMIEKGRLREYAEYKANSDPRAVELLRHLDLRHHSIVERFVPVSGPRFQANSKSGLHRPDVERWRRRIAERYAKPAAADVLVLLPCSARKPYSESRSHRRFADALEESGARVHVHEVIVTSPLGLVPRELECTYPAKEYDIPVTGDWDSDERAMVSGMLKAYLDRNRYAAVVSHLGDDMAWVVSQIPGAVETHGARSQGDALAELTRAIASASGGPGGAPRWGDRRRSDLESLARFQFGEAGPSLLEGCTVVERQGLIVALRERVQVASLSRERGLLSLTMEGGARLAKSGAYCVEIEDFRPKGNVFAVGVVSADYNIRTGDEVAVVHRGEVRAVGVAQMAGPYMAAAPEGEAVRVRHKLA